MKKFLIFLLAADIALVFTGCSLLNTTLSQPDENNTPLPEQQEVLPETSRPDMPDGHAVNDHKAESSLILTVGEQRFSAALLSSETAAAFIKCLPLTLNMSELNGNEKYFYLDTSLPTDSSKLGQINAGDLVLYGDNCLVLFYESFSSSYSYTRLGRLDDPAGLSEALGSGSVEITFSMD